MRAGILIVGDEILSGHTLDTNTGWLASRLHAIGIPVREVRVVPDEAPRIQGSIWELQERRDADAVFVCGGLGPTHDDRTVAAIAALHGVPLVRHEPTWRWLSARHAELHKRGKRPDAQVTAASAKMALVPAGAEVFANEAGAAPGLLARRVLVSRPGTGWTFVMPGVPQELQTLWSGHLEARLVRLAEGRLAPRVVRELVYRGYESEAAAVVSATADAHPDIFIGSYPHWGKKEVVLRVSGADPEAVAAAFALLHRRMEEAGHPVEVRPSATSAAPNA